MDASTRERLLALNRDFYERHARSFSESRDHPWPGWRQVVDGLAPGSRVLDAGCGNGRFAVFLSSACEVAATLAYTGIDASHALIEAARARSEELTPLGAARFVVGDVLDAPCEPADLVVAFGLVHHVPGFEARLALISALASRLEPEGRLAVTIWRFGSDPRIAGRAVAVDSLAPDVDPNTLEPGDQLLRWGDSRDVVRYCHFADDSEVEELVEQTRARGLELVERFRSDGRSGELNEYLVWSRREP